MSNKSLYESIFDDTEDIQLIKCFDSCVLEYWIDDCRVQVEKMKDENNHIEIEICISGYDEEGNHVFGNADFSEEWKEKNIYNQSIYKKFLEWW